MCCGESLQEFQPCDVKPPAPGYLPLEVLRSLSAVAHSSQTAAGYGASRVAHSTQRRQAPCSLRAAAACATSAVAVAVAVTVTVAMAVVAAEVAAAGEVEAAEAAAAEVEAAEAEAVGWTVGASGGGGGASLPMPTLPELRTVPTGRPAATPAAERDTLSLIGCVLSLGRRLPTRSKEVTLPLTSRIMSPAISPAASASPPACTFVTWMSVAGRGGVRVKEGEC